MNIYLYDMEVKELITLLENKYPVLNRDITWNTLKNRFVDKFTMGRHNPIIKQVIDIVCEENKINPELLFKTNRLRERVMLRQTVWFILHTYFYQQISLQEMAAVFNKKSHANSKHGIKNIEHLLSYDRVLLGQFKNYEDILYNKGVIKFKIFDK